MQAIEMISANLKAAGVSSIGISSCKRKIFNGMEPDASGAGKSWWRLRSRQWNVSLVKILFQTRVLMLLLRDPRTPLRARAVAGCAVLYLVSPIQLIPTFIPVIGQLDDLFVLWAGMKLVRKLTSCELVAELEARAKNGKLIEIARNKPQGVLHDTA